MGEIIIKISNQEFPSWYSGKNPTKNHEVAGWISGLDQWIKDPALP